MRRYTDVRYIPYLRTRSRAQTRWHAPVNVTVRNVLLFFRSILCLLCLVLALNTAGKNFYAAIENISEYTAAQLVIETIDNGVNQTGYHYQHDSFISVLYNKDGRVTSIETNTMAINHFAAQLSEHILKEMKDNEGVKIQAPLGALTGNGLLSSLGFSVPYRIVPAGKVLVSPVSSFESAGINQSIHRLKMEVSVQVKILFPLMTKEEVIIRDILVSETVILGEVPDFMTRNW